MDDFRAASWKMNNFILVVTFFAIFSTPLLSLPPFSLSLSDKLRNSLICKLFCLSFFLKQELFSSRFSFCFLSHFWIFFAQFIRCNCEQRNLFSPWRFSLPLFLLLILLFVYETKLVKFVTSLLGNNFPFVNFPFRFSNVLHPVACSCKRRNFSRPFFANGSYKKNLPLFLPDSPLARPCNIFSFFPLSRFFCLSIIIASGENVSLSPLPLANARDEFSIHFRPTPLFIFQYFLSRLLAVIASGRKSPHIFSAEKRDGDKGTRTSRYLFFLSFLSCSSCGWKRWFTAITSGYV